MQPICVSLWLHQSGQEKKPALIRGNGVDDITDSLILQKEGMESSSAENGLPLHRCPQETGST
jgi:hypothetical protein